MQPGNGQPYHRQSGKGRFGSGTVILAALVLACLTASWSGGPRHMAAAAAQSGSEGFPDIPIPKTQRKIAIGGEKDFADGTLSVTVASAERTSAEVTVTGGTALSLSTGSLSFVELDAETICTLTYLGKIGKKAIVAARCDPASESLRAALAAQGAAEDRPHAVSPLELVAATARGELKNPYRDSAQAIAEGRRLFLANSCNGCHGGTGGGGMGPPLSNAVWVYGADDDTLFRLVVEGSDVLLGAGYSRIGRENVVGPMPPFGEIIEDSDQLWKILAFVRSIYNDDPAKKSW